MVKPQYKDHAQVTTDVIFTSRWSLCTGCFVQVLMRNTFQGSNNKNKNKLERWPLKQMQFYHVLFTTKSQLILQFQIGEK